jgi:DNA (cytosine-5)-methyltransferase 1
LNAILKWALMKQGPAVIDLFAGAGGLSVGATTAGCTVRASVEIDKAACDTLRLNADFHGKVLQADVCGLTGDRLRSLAGLGAKDPLIIVGGAPCQPFSKAAYWVEDGDEARFRRERSAGKKVCRPARPTEVRPDHRRDLVCEFWRLVAEARADGFLFENVPSIKHPRNRPVLDAFKHAALERGFMVTELVANAAGYGVAQTRERVFVLGSKYRQPVVPAATHAIQDEPDILLKPAVTAAEAMDGLDTDDHFEPEEIVSGRWAKHLKEVPPGWNYKAHTAWAGHPDPTFVTETRFWNFLLKLSPDRPSWTLAASPGPWTGPFHWRSRRLRTAEMAALQGFPRGYRVSGSRRDRVKQMGNAAPPPLARVMIESVAEAVGR